MTEGMDDRNERTFVLIKPDAMQRRLMASILARLERKGLRLVACRLVRMDQARARALYAVHEGKDFYEPLVRFIQSGPVLASVWQGRSAISVVRGLIGPTYGIDALPGTIRGDWGVSRRHNLVHASDSPEAAQREMSIVFGPQDVLDWSDDLAGWVYEHD